jgi:hypothetical protein
VEHSFGRIEKRRASKVGTHLRMRPASEVGKMENIVGSYAVRCRYRMSEATSSGGTELLPT